MTRLADLLNEAQPGFACGKEDADGVFQFRMHNVSKSSEIALDKRRRVPWSAHKDVERFLVHPGDVLFNATNSPDGVGKSVLVPQLDEPAVFSNHFVRLRPDDARLDPNYLWRWLQWQFQRGVFRGMTRQWVNQATVSRNDLLSLDIPAPPVDEQRRVAAILDHADDLRARRRTALGYLDELGLSVFLEMFGDPLANNRGLDRAPIGSVATVVTGNSPPRADTSNFGDEIEWIKSDNLGPALATRAQEWLSAQGRRRARTAPPGSVLVTCIAGTPASIGKASIVDREVAFNQQINAVLPSEKVDTTFLLAQFKVAPSLVRRKSTGGMKGLVSKSAFQSIEILVPAVELQREFAARAERVAVQRASAQRAAAAADDLFVSLQAAGLSGRL